MWRRAFADQTLKIGSNSEEERPPFFLCMASTSTLKSIPGKSELELELNNFPASKQRRDDPFLSDRMNPIYNSHYEP
jgi:hypothetical protein